MENIPDGNRAKRDTVRRNSGKRRLESHSAKSARRVECRDLDSIGLSAHDFDALNQIASPAVTAFEVPYYSFFEMEFGSTKFRSLAFQRLDRPASWRERQRIYIATQHLPWLVDNNVMLQNYLRSLTPPSKLFNADDIVHSVAHINPDERSEYFIDLFFQKRFFGARRSSFSEGRASYRQLIDSWTSFVASFNESPHGFIQNLITDRDDFLKRVFAGQKMAVHRICYKNNFHCAIPKQLSCPMCFSDAQKMPEAWYKKSDENFKLPREVLAAILSFFSTYEAKQREDARRHILENDVELRREIRMNQFEADLLGIRSVLNKLSRRLTEVENSCASIEATSLQIRHRHDNMEETMEEFENHHGISAIPQIQNEVRTIAEIVKNLVSTTSSNSRMNSLEST